MKKLNLDKLAKLSFKTKVLILVGVILVSSGVFYLSSSTQDQLDCPGGKEITKDLIERIETIGQGRSYKDLANLSQQLRCRIQAIGAEAANEELYELAKDYERELLHDFGHEFGAALYAEEGLDGFAVCDQRYYGGCAHDFLGNIIAAKGIDGVKELWSHCSDNYPDPSSCHHGVGHGLSAYYGYHDISALEDAVKVCDSFEDNDDILGCNGGAYMEYSLRTMLPDEPVLEIDEDNLYAHCAELDEKFHNGCYHWLPQLWWIGLDAKYPDMPKVELLQYMADVCETLEGSASMTCLAGVGKLAPAGSNFDPLTAAQMCRMIPNVDSSFICQAWAANTFHGTLMDNAELACEGLTGERMDYCLHYASPEADMRTMLDLEDLPVNF